MRNRIITASLAVAITIGFGATAQAQSATTAKVTARPSWAPFGTKACAEEDSDGPCYWDARSRGNGKGNSFYVIPVSRRTKAYTYPGKPSLNGYAKRVYN